jgi:hypothetical protein
MIKHVRSSIGPTLETRAWGCVRVLSGCGLTPDKSCGFNWPARRLGRALRPVEQRSFALSFVFAFSEQREHEMELAAALNNNSNRGASLIRTNARGDSGSVPNYRAHQDLVFGFPRAPWDLLWSQVRCVRGARRVGCAKQRSQSQIFLKNRAHPIGQRNVPSRQSSRASRE